MAETKIVGARLDSNLDLSASTLKLADGTVSAPGLTFNSDPDTGIYRIGANDLGIATNGTLGLEINSGQAVIIKGINTDTNSVVGTVYLRGTGSVTENRIIRFSGNSGPNDLLLYEPASASELRFAFTNGSSTTDLMVFDQSGRLTTTAPAANTNRLIFNDGNTQKEFIESFTGASTAGLLLSVNRDPVSGTFQKTGQTGSSITLTSNNGSGSVTIQSSNTNNTSPGTVATFAASGVSIQGTTTNDNAASGFVGEYVSANFGPATSTAATDVWWDITSISLPAGDWDVSMMMWAGRGASSTMTRWEMGISTTSGNTSSGMADGRNWAYTHIADADSGGDTSATNAIPVYRMSLSGTTTVYAKMRHTHAGGTAPSYSGRIDARRVR